MTEFVNYDADVPDWLIEEAEYQMEEFGSSAKPQEKSESIPIKIVDVNKNRVYVDSESDVPSWATPQQGERDEDAVYYDSTERPEDIVEAPKGLEYDKIEEITSMEDEDAMREENLAGGASSESMSFGYIQVDGERQRVYIQEASDNWDRKDELTHLQAKTTMDHLDVRAPNMHYNAEEDVILMEDIGENSNRPNRKAVESGELYANADKEKFLDAICAKYVVGDTDLSGNIMLDDNGEFYPIDYDLAGSKLTDKKEMANNPDRHAYHEDGLLGKMMETIDYHFNSHLDQEVTEDDIVEKLEELVEDLDIEELEDNFERLDGEGGEIGNAIIQNINDIREGTLWE